LSACQLVSLSACQLVSLSACQLASSFDLVSKHAEDKSTLREILYRKATSGVRRSMATKTTKMLQTFLIGGHYRSK
jgi:hypothetical protein